MKKNILGLVAVAVALCASAFTLPSKAVTRNTDLYWFSISNTLANSAVMPANATFIQQSATAPVESCPSGTAHQCVSGFDASQVNTSTDQLNGTQTPQSKSQLKN